MRKLDRSHVGIFLSLALLSGCESDSPGGAKSAASAGSTASPQDSASVANPSSVPVEMPSSSTPSVPQGGGAGGTPANPVVGPPPSGGGGRAPSDPGGAATAGPAAPSGEGRGGGPTSAGGGPAQGGGGELSAGGSTPAPSNEGGAPSGGTGGGSMDPEPNGGSAGSVDAGVTPDPSCVAPTEYPNLFATLSGHSQQETDEKVAAAWNQLYNPSNNNTVYYDGPGQDESYVKDTGNNDVRTEGMSYGMMTAVQLDKQTEFDRLWTWVKNHMANGTGEISWKCSPSGQKQSNGGAPDGEEYMATALIFAENRWGDTGKFDYAEEARWVLDLTRTKYFHQDYHIVKFVSGSNNTDGSYVLPAFYKVWACFDTENADFWNEAVTAGREFFHAAADQNGVIPDQSSFTGQALGGAGSDAKRCVMNIMMDHNFFGEDPWQVDTYATAFGSYMSSHGDNTAAQFSCNALLGFGLPEQSGKPFVDKLWSAQIPTGTYRYYDGTLYMLALLHVSGTFKLWY